MPHVVMMSELEIELVRRTLKFEWFPGSEEERRALIERLTPPTPTLENGNSRNDNVAA